MAQYYTGTCPAWLSTIILHTTYNVLLLCNNDGNHEEVKSKHHKFIIMACLRNSIINEISDSEISIWELRFQFEKWDFNLEFQISIWEMRFQFEKWDFNLRIPNFSSLSLQSKGRSESVANVAYTLRRTLRRESLKLSWSTRGDSSQTWWEWWR